MKHIIQYYFFLVSFLVGVQTANGQSYIEYIEQFPKKDIAEATEKFGRAYLYKESSPNALLFFDEIIKYAEQNNNTELISVANRIIGTYYAIALKDFPTAYRYLDNSLQIAETNKILIQKAKALHSIGYFEYRQGDFISGLKKLMSADYLMKEIGYQNIYDISRHLYNLGLTFSDLYNIEKSNSYLNLSIQYGTDKEAIMAALNNLGHNYKIQKKYDLALIYCTEALNLATSLNDSLRIGIISGNIGEIYLNIDSIAKGVSFLKRTEQLCYDYKDYVQSITASMMLAKVDLTNQQFETVKTRLNNAKPHFLQNDFKYKEEALIDFYTLQTEIYKIEKNYELASAAQDSIIKIKDRKDITFTSNMLKNVETSILVEQFNADLEKSESARKKQATVLITGIIFLTLVLLVIYLFYTKKLEHKKQNLYKLELKQKNIENELLFAKERLQNFVQSLKEKNSIIVELNKELDEINQLKSIPSTEKEDVIQKMRQTTILTDNDWNNFKITFEKVYPHFFANILKDFPTLTVTELRILSLIKLSLSADEMAALLGVSPDSIKRTFRRIRTKINVPNQISLEITIKNF